MIIIFNNATFHRLKHMYQHTHTHTYHAHTHTHTHTHTLTRTHTVHTHTHTYTHTVRMGGGDDPHFSIALPSGELLCFTVQGERGFAFNLVSNKRVKINTLFVPDSEREEVTWMGSLGIVVQGEGYQGSNKTSLRFDAKTKQVEVENKVTLDANGIDSLAFRNGKLIISEKDQEKDHDYKHPSVCVNLEDLGLHFHVTFFGEHLDIYWNSVTGEQEGNTHGLIGRL